MVNGSQWEFSFNSIPVYVTDTVVEPPLIVAVPEDGDIAYPDIDPMEYEYVPSGSVNDMDDDAVETEFPLTTIDHEVPDGNPDSVNVSEYV